ncbi:MAG: ABC transporter permease [Acidimicrobiales bacterium]|nr:ABC transporter permease [Acidimicrobiales bacterium]
MIWVIARREVVTRARSKPFMILTGLLFVGVIAVAILANVLGGDDDKREISIGLAGTGVDAGELLAAGSPTLDVEIVRQGASVDALEDGEIDVLFDGSTLTWQDFADPQIDSFIRDTLSAAQFERRAGELDLAPADIQRLFEPVDIAQETLAGDDSQFGVRFVAAGASGLATFMLLQIWGAFLMMGVIEEKSSKVVEILLSHVRPRTLLAGKVLGLGLLAVGQMLILVGGLVVGLLLVRDIEIPSGVWTTAPLSLATFVLGFAFYSSMFAAVGSTVSRQEDANSAQIPAMLPLIAGYMIAAFSIENPDNPAVVIGSFVPFSAPVLLPFRNAFADLALWEVALSLAILSLSSVVMIRLAGWIYRYSLLRTGARTTYADLWRNRNADVL